MIIFLLAVAVVSLTVLGRIVSVERKQSKEWQLKAKRREYQRAYRARKKVA